MPLIDEWLKEENYAALLKFVLDTILNILRTKLAQLPNFGKELAKGADDIVMLEMCTINKVISYPDFIQIVQVLNNMDRVSDPKLEVSETMILNRSDPQLMNKYIPDGKQHVNYNFSDASGFRPVAMKKVSEGEAKRALRTLVDFMKTEISERDQGLAYEPLFTHLTKDKRLQE